MRSKIIKFQQFALITRFKNVKNTAVFTKIKRPYLVSIVCSVLKIACEYMPEKN